jgi:hypothetical protein
MRLTILLAVSVLLTAGCASPPVVWNHPTKSDQEWYADYAECEAQAGQAAGAFGPGSAIFVRVEANCLRGGGYYIEN